MTIYRQTTELMAGPVGTVRRRSYNKLANRRQTDKRKQGHREITCVTRRCHLRNNRVSSTRDQGSGRVPDEDEADTCLSQRFGGELLRAESSFRVRSWGT